MPVKKYVHFNVAGYKKHGPNQRSIFKDDLRNDAPFPKWDIDYLENARSTSVDIIRFGKLASREDAEKAAQWLADYGIPTIKITQVTTSYKEEAWPPKVKKNAPTE